MKQKKHNGQLIKWTASILLTFLIFTGCRKTDNIWSDPIMATENYDFLKSKFFNASTADQEVQKVAADIRKQDSLFKFLPEFVKKNGMPIWDKVLYKTKGKNIAASLGNVQTESNSIANNSSSTSTESEQGLFFIPLQSQNSQEIKSFITAYKHGDSTYTYKLYNKDSLSSNSYQDGNTKKALINSLGVLAFFEKSINNQETSQYNLSSNEVVEFKNPNLILNDTETTSLSGINSNSLSTSSTSGCSYSITITETWTEINVYVNGELVYHYESYSVSVVAVFQGDCSGGGGGGGYDPNGGGSGGWYNWGTGYNNDPYWNNYNYSGWYYPWWTSGGGGSGGGSSNTVRSGEFDPTVTDFDPDISWWDDNTTSYPPQLLPSWSNMESNYPKKADGTEMCGADVYNLVGGQVLANMPGGGNPNACALRVSRALNYSGVVIPEIPGHTFKGSDNKNYFLSAAKLYDFMIKTFTMPPNAAGSVEPFSGAQGGTDGSNFPSLLSGKQGIYLMQANYPGQFGATGHASIWNGSSCVHNNCDGIDHDGAYFNAQGGVHKIALFKLN